MKQNLRVKGQNRLWLLPCLLVLLTLPAASAEADQKVHADRWFVVKLGDDRVGWSHTRQTERDGKITTDTQTRFTIRRGPVTLNIEQGSQFIETLDGQPVEASSTTLSGQMTQKQTLRFTESGVELVREQAGRTQSQKLEPFEDDWLTPAAAQRYIEQRMQAGDETIRFKTLDLSVGPQPFEATMQIVGEEEVEVFGRVAPAVVWESQMSIMPGIRVREHVDHRGRKLKSTTNLMPGMEITMLAADEQLARSDIDPPELLASLFITPDQPLPAPRQLQSAVYRVTFDDEINLDAIQLPRTGYQRVTWGDERTAIVTVDLSRPVEPGDDLPRDADRAASAMMDHEDPEVRKLLDRALGDEAGTLNKQAIAERLRDFVAHFITEKDLSVGLGTASEVARTAQGDCTEHAVLLAALLRAADIPARTATGLIYVDAFIGAEEVFGGHMWTQAWLPGENEVGGRWVDLDATLWDAAYDAAHITLGVSSMADDEMTNDMVALAPVLGRMQISVVDTGSTSD
ncbi:transglutaminase family protein [Phycisphaerales bacterium AB-hyl4]|uniref:Transglutaminase family protein n=1 Tax=Natronomicrosphaera hydrolytica TaxID=3242702 RepID=A0ABV4U596_9BACT